MASADPVTPAQHLTETGASVPAWTAVLFDGNSRITAMARIRGKGHERWRPARRTHRAGRQQRRSAYQCCVVEPDVRVTDPDPSGCSNAELIATRPGPVS